jgi:acyl carrier protein
VATEHASDEQRQTQLAEFIRREVAKDPRCSLEPDTPLVSSGLVDSMSLIQVLVFVEDSFGVVIPDEAATAASMDTLRSILGLIRAHEPPA